MVPKYHKNKLTPPIRDPWWLPYLFPIWRHNDHSFAHFCCYIAPMTKMQVSMLSFRCLGTVWQCQNSRQGAPILDFKMAAICFTLLCFLLPIALWKESKYSLYLGKKLLCGNCHHMAAISELKMAATLLDMHFSMIDRCRLPCQLSLRKLLYLHFVQMAAMFHFTMTPTLPVIFSVIEHAKTLVHV